MTKLERQLEASINYVAERKRQVAKETAMPSETTFKEAWAEKERQGYVYGHDALEQVRFGWDIAHEKLRAGRARIAAQARAEAIEECAAAIRKHRSEYEAALANPRDKEWDDGYRSGTSNALFIVEELANPDDVVREELIADTESVYSAERDSRT